MKQSTADRLRSTAGFTLVETLVAVLVVSLVMGAAFTGVMHGTRLSENVRLASGVNGSLRSSMDVVVRDLIQAGQGLPNGHRAGVPNGTGFAAIKRPIPASGSTDFKGFTTFNLAASLPAISVGYQLGINTSDTITILADDSRFSGIGVSAISAGTSSATATVVSTRNISVTNGGANNIVPGDLIDIQYGGGDVLMTVTAVSGQVITFGTDNTIDTLGLNQFGTNTDPSVKSGSINDVLSGTVDVTQVSLSRIKMTSYYIFRDSTTDSRYPRLLRRVNGRDPSTVAFAIENFTLTYDLASTDIEYHGINMSTADLAGTGACIDGTTNRPCSEDWIRKANLVIAGRSIDKTAQKNYITSSVFGQIATRSLAFQDRF